MYPRKNREIAAAQVRVIGPDGKQRGVMSIAEALNLARGLGLDLVEIAPNATPPVVRIIHLKDFKHGNPQDYSNN